MDKQFAKVKAPKEELTIKEPLFEIGVAVYPRGFEHAKQDFTADRIYADARGTANQEIILAGNRAAHTLNVKVTAALSELKILDPVSDGLCSHSLFIPH